MASGNLSWLNLLTMVLAIPMIDDRFLSIFLRIRIPNLHEPAPIYKFAVAAIAVLVVVLSVNPIRNMISPNQVMNTSYNPLHLVGTYGAFGGITRVRNEVIIEGTDDAVLTPATQWLEYGFKGKPGDVARLPTQIAPYHLRIDWLMWFAAMSDYSQHPWFFHLMAKLLQNDRDTLSLLGSNPFPHAPPRYVRALTYEYRFTTPEERKKTGDWWRRSLSNSYFPAVSLTGPAFHDVLEKQGWL
jgi:hypothetical protein